MRGKDRNDRLLQQLVQLLYQGSVPRVMNVCGRPVMFKGTPMSGPQAYSCFRLQACCPVVQLEAACASAVTQTKKFKAASRYATRQHCGYLHILQVQFLLEAS